MQDKERGRLQAFAFSSNLLVSRSPCLLVLNGLKRGNMIEPFKSDDALVAEIRATDPGGGCALWWVGQSGFLVKHAAGHLLFDPYLSESLTAKYAATDNPHVRMTRRPIDPARLNLIDVATSTHAHTDHFDPDTLRPLRDVNPEIRLVLPEANRAAAIQRLETTGDWLVGVNDGETIGVKAFTFHPVPAAHEIVERDEHGRSKYLGYVVRFGDPPITIYHSGDCVPFEGQAEMLSPFRVDIALLPINGRRRERRVSGNFWGREAADLARAMGAKLAVPCHFEMFEFNTEPPDEFVAACERRGQRYRVLRCGERLLWPETTN
jgi:L-ascorbate metabolism protein UlaG (beta-lactamase superfamily)